MTITIIKFEAEWCAPCKQLKPLWNKLKKERKEDFNFMEVDVDKYPNIASEHNIRSIPTILVFKNGEIINSYVGDECNKGLNELEVF